MKFNPFEEKPIKLDKCFSDWTKLAPSPYDKNEVDPYTKVRIILMNGTEFEAGWFMHQFSRHCENNDIRREVALVRRIEMQQQKKIAALKPINENILETTISYEQLAVDLTAALSQKEQARDVKEALNFALLEDFDHLYRYSDLLEEEHKIHAERLVGGYTEIMPGRPTISEHRYPYDDIKRGIHAKKSDPLTKLHVGIITAAEQQTMNFYMNVANLYPSEMGRKLFTEIGMIEEQHVSQYESLMDPTCTWLENLLMHEYTECYLYYSMLNDETDEHVKKIWQENLEQEIAHLHNAARLLKKYENKEWQSVIPDGAFPDLLHLGPNKEFIRKVMKTVNMTAMREGFIDLEDIDDNAEFFKYQKMVNKKTANVASHVVIDNYIKRNGEDYRFEESQHPVKELRDRKVDNTEVGRNKDYKKSN